MMTSTGKICVVCGKPIEGKVVESAVLDKNGKHRSYVRAKVKTFSLDGRTELHSHMGCFKVIIRANGPAGHGVDDLPLQAPLRRILSHGVRAVVTPHSIQ